MYIYMSMKLLAYVSEHKNLWQYVFIEAEFSSYRINYKFLHFNK